MVVRYWRRCIGGGGGFINWICWCWNISCDEAWFAQSGQKEWETEWKEKIEDRTPTGAATNGRKRTVKKKYWVTEREQGVHRKSKQTKSCPSRKKKKGKLKKTICGSVIMYKMAKRK